MIKQNYEISLQNHVYWQSRFKYLELLQNYLNRKISGNDFLNQFYSTWSQDCDRTYLLLQNLEWKNYILFSYSKVDAKKKDNFSTLIDTIFYLCEIVDMDIEEIWGENYGSEDEISEVEFRKRLTKHIMPEFLKYCPENFNDFETLLLTMIILIISASFFYFLLNFLIL